MGINKGWNGTPKCRTKNCFFAEILQRHQIPRWNYKLPEHRTAFFFYMLSEEEKTCTGNTEGTTSVGGRHPCRQRSTWQDTWGTWPRWAGSGDPSLSLFVLRSGVGAVMGSETRRWPRYLRCWCDVRWRNTDRARTDGNHGGIFPGKFGTEICFYRSSDSLRFETPTSIQLINHLWKHWKYFVFSIYWIDTFPFHRVTLSRLLCWFSPSSHCVPESVLQWVSRCWVK